MSYDVKTMREWIAENFNDDSLCIAVYLGEGEFSTLDLTEDEIGRLQILLLQMLKAREEDWYPLTLDGERIPEEFRSEARDLMRKILAANKENDDVEHRPD